MNYGGQGAYDVGPEGHGWKDGNNCPNGMFCTSFVGVLPC